MNHGETRKTITLENQPFPHRPCFNTATVCKHEVTRNKSHHGIYRPPPFAPNKYFTIDTCRFGKIYAIILSLQQKE